MEQTQGNHHAKARQKEERALLLAARAGDVEAFGRLLRLYERRVYSLVRRVVWRQDEAVEVTQEVFLEAYRSQHRFDASRPFRPWLFKIAVHCCRKAARKKSFGEQPAEIALHDTEAPLWGRPDDNPEQLVSRKETAEQLGRCMSQLNEGDRALLLLRFWESMPYAQLRSVYGVPETILKMRVHRALKRLRGLMAEAMQ